LLDSLVTLEVLGERVLPLGLGAVLVGGCDPEGFEFLQRVEAQDLVG